MTLVLAPFPEMVPLADRLAMPLRFAAATARELGALHVGLVAPYLRYMRQDRRFHPGEAVSAPLLAVWIAANVPDAILWGPDSESRQWVTDVARRAGRPLEVLTKIRNGDRQVELSLPDCNLLRTGIPVILDDIASSGRTLFRAIERLAEADARAPVCVIIHAVFSDAARVVTTDSIPHRSNAIALAAPLAVAIRECTAEIDTPALEGSTHKSTRKTKGKTDD